MLNAAEHWVLSHKAGLTVLRDWSVRLLLLALPWQARWFAEAPSLNGYPWEFGRVSIYLSWGVVVVAAVFSLCLRPRAEESEKVWKHSLPFLLLALLLPIVFTTSPHATFSWWLTTLAAALVFIVLRFSGMTTSKITFWFTLGLVPHLALGFWQVFAQSSPSFSWLGLAAHDPATLGTSVIEWSGGRFLRAYGGFPHPNIFGGWLAVGLVLVSSIEYRVTRKMRVWFLAYAALAGAMLVLTFSRSALIAAALGCAAAFLFLRGRDDDRRKSWPFFLALLAGVVVTSVLVWPVLTTRFASEARLETKSLDVRAEAKRNGMELVRRHPFVGVGFGATTAALMEEGLWPADPQAGPPEPPHNVPLMVLVEMGGLPFVLLLMAVWLDRRRLSDLAAARSAWPILAASLPLLFFDHYLWTLWPGKALLAVVLAILFLPAPTLDETPKIATMA
jgi:hypothetical protein